MDAQKFGEFLQQCRKEMGMTQVELAQQLHVTDKAISHWERGIGFPDINLLEPLAQTLDITLVELMQSRRIEQDILSAESIQSAVTNTLEIAQQEKLKKEKQQASMRKMITAVVALICVGWVGYSLYGVATRPDTTGYEVNMDAYEEVQDELYAED